LINFFEKELLSLVGQPCLGVIAGTGSGSMMTIELGRPVDRGGPVKNSHISEILRSFRGEYCVFVEGCAWRLDKSDGVVCGWRDMEETIRERMQILAGRKVTAAELLRSGFDLNLVFDGGYILHLFCDLTAGDLDNYSVRLPSGWYSIQPGSRVVRQHAES